MSDIYDIFRSIEDKSKIRNLIYRGEPNCCESDQHDGRVGSRLWRDVAKFNEYCDVELVEQAFLADANKHVREPNLDELRNQIQHYGGNTNLIDFTRSSFIALFFACNNCYEQNGRVILQDANAVEDMIVKPRYPENRVIAQKSVFILHPEGNFKPEDENVVIIPATYKLDLLIHLERYHDISIETIYNDVHGYVKYQFLHGNAYSHFFAGYACASKQEYVSAIYHFTQTIIYNPSISPAYSLRGNVYAEQGQYDAAIGDYDKAIELSPSDHQTYTYRGIAYAHKQEYDNAIFNYNTAIGLNSNYAPAYFHRGMMHTIFNEDESAMNDFRTALAINPDILKHQYPNDDEQGIMEELGQIHPRIVALFNQAR